ncbi:MAG: translation initiation factor IF-2 subunit beta [Candidatus Nanohaloarchaeota archaeon]|nr:translation initiation factor IF-2 subunit beta [Candidatus Nanohaloarchaeota archaeon]
MEFYSYEELLERAYKALPERSEEAEERWEAPSLVSMITGNRTFIKNFVEACKHIRREEKEVMKYLLKELGTQGYLESNVLVLLGKFPNKTINDKFQRYIKYFVMCPICGKPDTHIIKEGRLKFIKCEACGARNPVPQI